VNQIPPVVDFAVIAQLPEPPEVIIHDTLRQGGRMLISAPAKEGKSTLLIQLAMALSIGGTWLGRQCGRRRTLYVNLEVSSAECLRRVKAVGDAMGVGMEDYPLVQNLDQAGTSLESLAKTIIYRARQLQVQVVIIDPVYTLIGDEVASSEIKKLVKTIGFISNELGASVIFSHHHNKGVAPTNQRNHMDKVSGSSVFGRFPDAIMTFQLQRDGRGKAFFTLRSFQQPEPLQIKFDYPLFNVDDSPVMDLAPPMRLPSAPGRPPKVTQGELEAFLVANPDATAANVATTFNISPSAAYGKLKQARDAASRGNQNPVPSNASGTVDVEVEIPPLVVEDAQW
jgi:hypothetical protein